MALSTETLSPLTDRVVIRPIGDEVITSSGLVIAGMEERNLPKRGLVLSVGPGVTQKGHLVTPDVQVGEEIYYVHDAGVEVDGETHIVTEGVILARKVGDEIVPYWDKVLVELVPEGGVRSSGLILMADSSANFDHGVVVAAGPGFTLKGKRAPMELAKGDRVLFSQFSGAELDLGVEDPRHLFITREHDVHGILS